MSQSLNSSIPQFHSPISRQASSREKLGQIAQIVKFPLPRVHLELTNACNFDCTFCPKPTMTRPNGLMKTATAKSLIDQLADNGIAEKVTFHIMGEPMLHPDFFEIVRYVRERGMKSGITTNGSFFNPETAGTLRNLEVDQMNISLQTPDENSFGTRKAKNITYEQYSQGILDAIGILRSDGGRTTIKLHFLVTKFNTSVKEVVGHLDIINDTQTLRRVFRDWVQRIYQLPGISNRGSEDKARQALSSITINRWNVLEIAPGIHFETYLLDSWGNSLTRDQEKIVQSSHGYCPALTDHFGILWNGDMVLCCKDYDGKTRVGNAAESGIVPLLNSEAVLSVVKGFKKCRVVHPQCRICLGGKTPLSALAKQAGSIFFFRWMKWFFYNQKKLY